MRFTDRIKFQLVFPLHRRLFGKLAAIIGQDRMDTVRRPLDQPPEECTSVFAFGAFGQFCKDKLGGAINSHKEFELALLGSDMADVQMKVADGICLETLLGWLAFRLRQAVDAMALETVMKGRPGQMRDRILQRVKTVIQRQKGLSTEGHNKAFFFFAEHSGSALFRSHRQVFDRIALLPLRDRLGVDAIPLCQLPYALLTILYRSAGCLCRCGARVKYLSHNASLCSLETVPL